MSRRAVLNVAGFRTRVLLNHIQARSWHSSRTLYSNMPAYDAVRRKLIVCCDGTWQSSTSGERNIPSNVTRMARHLGRSEVKEEVVDAKTGKTETTLWNQLVFYDAGIGTGDLSEADVTRAGGTGAGLAQNVIEAYNWLVLNWQPGDQIFCFGFSRGAYTARSLAGFIAELGICHPLDMQFFPIIYDLYEGALFPENKEDTEEIITCRKNYEKMRQQWMDGGKMKLRLGDDAQGQQLDMTTCDRKPISPESRRVEVVGVWDTVGSLGVPKIGGWLKLPTLPWSSLDKPGRQFHDVRISNNIRHAFHALALDERRFPFTPTVWYVPFEGPARHPDLSLKQVWFPGVHINVGGGSDDMLKERKSDAEQIANITFAWMLENVRPYLHFDEASLTQAMSDQQRLLETLKQNYDVANVKSGWAKGNVIDSFSEAGVAIKLGGYRWRSPGETYQPENLVNKHEERTTRLGTTNEEIHPCVFYRMTARGKRNPALAKFKRVANQDPTKGWEWVKAAEEPERLAAAHRIIRLPEYRIKDQEAGKPRNLERAIAEINGAGDYLKVLDEMYKTGVDKTKPDNSITDLLV